MDDKNCYLCKKSILNDTEIFLDHEEAIFDQNNSFVKFVAHYICLKCEKSTDIYLKMEPNGNDDTNSRRDILLLRKKLFK